MECPPPRSRANRFPIHEIINYTKDRVEKPFSINETAALRRGRAKLVGDRDRCTGIQLSNQ